MNVCVGNPICCPPQYVVRDFCTPRIVPVIQPVVTVNRQNIVDVPQLVVQPSTRNVVVNRGFQQGFGGGFGGNTLFNTPVAGGVGGRGALFGNVGAGAGLGGTLF